MIMAAPIAPILTRNDLQSLYATQLTHPLTVTPMSHIADRFGQALANPGDTEHAMPILLRSPSPHNETHALAAGEMVGGQFMVSRVRFGEYRTDAGGESYWQPSTAPNRGWSKLT